MRKLSSVLMKKLNPVLSHLYFYYAAVWNRDKCSVYAARVGVKIKDLIFPSI